MKREMIKYCLLVFRFLYFFVGETSVFLHSCCFVSHSCLISDYNLAAIDEFLSVNSMSSRNVPVTGRRKVSEEKKNVEKKLGCVEARKVVTVESEQKNSDSDREVKDETSPRKHEPNTGDVESRTGTENIQVLEKSGKEETRLVDVKPGSGEVTADTAAVKMQELSSQTNDKEGETEEKELKDLSEYC